MTSGLARADTESHDDYPDRPLPDGVMTGPPAGHRYAVARPSYADPDAEAREEQRREADKGRTPYGRFALRRWQQHFKVNRRLWAADPKQVGQSYCKRCGFHASHDEAKILHQQDHAERDQVSAMLSDDHDKHVAADADLRAELAVARREIAELRLVLYAFVVASGSPGEEALQHVVDRIIPAARGIDGVKGG